MDEGRENEERLKLMLTTKATGGSLSIMWSSAR